MGELISARADVGRIEDHVRRALRAARARGGDVAEAAEERLAPGSRRLTERCALLTPRARQRRWRGRRPARRTRRGHRHQDPARRDVECARATAPEPSHGPGVSRRRHDVHAGQPHAATDVDEGPALAADVGLGAAMDEGPVRRLERPDRTPARALRNRGETHRPTEAAVTVAEVGYRSAVRDGQARLRAFKRDPSRTWADRSPSARDHPRRGGRGDGDGGQVPERRGRDWPEAWRRARGLEGS